MSFKKKMVWLFNASILVTAFQNCAPSRLALNIQTPSQDETASDPFLPSPEAKPSPSCRAQAPLAVIGKTNSTNLRIDRKENLVIDGKAFTYSPGEQNCLYITNSTNITIKNSSFIDCYRGVVVEGSVNVVIEDSYFENNVTGVLALSATAIKVQNNRFKNTAGGRWYSLTSAFDQNVVPNTISFNKIYGAGNEVTCNLSLNKAGESKSEDLISTFQSQGTPSSPILIQKNCLQGGGPSPSGGGIMVGDQGGRYITAQDNILINVGQYSLAIAGGHHNKILRNKILATERPGFPLDTGIYVHDYGNSLDGSGCSNHTVEGNQVSCVHGGTNCGAAKGNECGDVSSWANNDWGTPGSRSLGPDLSQLNCPFDY